MRICVVVMVVVAAVLSASPSRGQAVSMTSAAIEGIVVDVAGGVVAGARVEGPGLAMAALSDANGRFSIDVSAARPSTLRVSAAGFATIDVRVPPGDAGLLRIVIAPAPLDEAVTVTASRGADRLATAPTTTVLSGAALVSSGAGAIDDALRQTPGFSLFRRSTSRVANPTTQGVTLRGVSGSGASRSSVLVDGVSLNDPFGSWVYWNRVPLASIDRIEVMRGAGGDLYGAEALGGVVQVVTAGASRTSGVRAIADYGRQDSARVSGLAAATARGWSVSATAEWYDTTGAFVVAATDRGAIDTRAASTYLTTGAAVSRASASWQATLRVRASDEQRANGTRLQVNDTNWRQWSADVSGAAMGGQWSLRGAAGTQGYYQTFSAILAARASERLTSEQRIPTRVALGQAQWARAWSRFALLAGADGHRTRAEQTERRYGTTGALIAQTLTGGTERAWAAFVRASYSPASSLTLTAGTRAERAETTPLAANLDAHGSTMVNPRVNATWRLSNRVTTHAAAYRSSRAPTLNERYRAFRVGNVLTNANAALTPERLAGAEGGLRWDAGLVIARATAFWNSLGDAVTNVTVATTSSQTTRERQNTDTLRARGLELETEWRPAGWLTMTASVTAGRSRVHLAPAQPHLVGNDLPQAPRVGWAAGAVMTRAALGTLTFQVRRVGRQFDDDLNSFALAPFTIADAAYLRQVSRGVYVLVAAENLFDAEYDVARTPTRSIGWPRAVRVGVRVEQFRRHP